MGYKVAIVGATGNVGQAMLDVLAEREFPVDEVFAIASRRSLGREVSFGEKTLKCHDLEQFDFSKCDFALMSAGGRVSKEWSPKIGAADCGPSRPRRTRPSTGSGRGSLLRRVPVHAPSEGLSSRPPG